jgi:hypothetical protein
LSGEYLTICLYLDRYCMYLHIFVKYYVIMMINIKVMCNIKCEI